MVLIENRKPIRTVLHVYFTFSGYVGINISFTSTLNIKKYFFNKIKALIWSWGIGGTLGLVIYIYKTYIFYLYNKNFIRLYTLFNLLKFLSTKSA